MNKKTNKRKISKKFIVYVIVTMLIMYMIIFSFGLVYKIDISIILIAFVPLGIIWIIYSFITLNPYVYEKKSNDEKENKNE